MRPNWNDSVSLGSNSLFFLIDIFTQLIIVISVVRLKFKVNEIWSPDFSLSNSQAYKSKAEEIERALEHLYNDKKASDSRNRIRARVIQIM